MTVEELLAKQAVVEGLYRYCRSLDRMDRALYGTVFEPGAALDYGQHFRGTAEEFCEWVWKSHEAMQAHSHQISNVLADVDPAAGRAVSEAYVTVCLRTNPDPSGAVADIVDRGRYVDRWVRGDDGEWRIAARRYLSDVQHVTDASASPPVTAVRDRTHPSYELLGCNIREPVTSGVVVSGGASGIGKACAEALAEAGRPVAVWDLNEAGAKEVAASLGVPSIGIGLDVTDAAALEDAAAQTRTALPSIGGIVHAAGMVITEPVGQIDFDHFRRVLDVNLTAHARITQLLLPDLKAANPGSAVVGIASIEAVIGHAAIPAYCSSKAGLVGLTRSMAATLGPEGIRVNAVCPGYIETPMLAPALVLPGMREGCEKASVLGRIGQPEDIAGVVRFLLSADAGFVTGQAVVADGGVTAVD